jgi:hypothetical protein
MGDSELVAGLAAVLRGSHDGRVAVFRAACEDGNLGVAVWAFGLGPLDVHEDHDFAFRVAVEGGHLAVVRWLAGLGGVNVYANSCQSFTNACMSGDLPMLQFLESLARVSVAAQFFPMVCEFGYLKMAQWIEGLGHVPLAVDHGVFWGACRGCHLGVVKWLAGRHKPDAWVAIGAVDGLSVHIIGSRCGAALAMVNWLVRAYPEVNWVVMVSTWAALRGMWWRGSPMNDGARPTWIWAMGQ